MEKKNKHMTLDSVYTRLDIKLQPQRNATNMDGSKKRRCVFGVSRGNPAPLFQFEKSIFDEMTDLIKIFIIESLILPVLLGGNHSNHSVFFRKLYYFIRIVSAICKKIFCRNIFNQSHSFFAISSGTFCDKYSDRHTKRIHGKVNLGIEPPFVRDIS